MDPISAAMIATVVGGAAFVGATHKKIEEAIENRLGSVLDAETRLVVHVSSSPKNPSTDPS